MKRVFGAFILTIVLTFSGCNSGKMDIINTEPVNIKLWHYYTGENQKSVDCAVEDFNKTVGMEKGIIVTAQAKGSSFDLENAITDSADGLIDSEEMPDIFSAYPDKALEIYKKGLLCDLNKYFTKEEKSEYVEVFINDAIFEDKAFVLMPIAKSTEVLYVNNSVYKKFAEDENISENAFDTFEKIYETAEKYYNYTDKKTPKKGDGKSLIGFDSTASFFIMGCKELGLDVADTNSQKAILNKKILKRVFENFYKGHVLGYYGKEGKYRTDDLKTGVVISYVGSSAGASYFPTWIERDGKQKEIKLKVLDYPKFEGGKSLTISQGAGMCVTKSDEKKEKAAATFLKWFTSKEQNIKFVRVSGYLPVKVDAYNSSIYDSSFDKTSDEQLDKIKQDKTLMENVLSVYDLSMKQIKENRSYSVKPFTGSYKIRKAFDSTVEEAIKSGKSLVEKMHKENVFEREEILRKLDFDACFEDWFESLTRQLKKHQVSYDVIS